MPGDGFHAICRGFGLGSTTFKYSVNFCLEWVSHPADGARKRCTGPEGIWADHRAIRDGPFTSLHLPVALRWTVLGSRCVPMSPIIDPPPTDRHGPFTGLIANAARFELSGFFRPLSKWASGFERKSQVLNGNHVGLGSLGNELTILNVGICIDDPRPRRVTERYLR